MNLPVIKARWLIDSEGTWLSLLTYDTKAARAISESVEPDKAYVAEVKRAFKKRSKNANDYLWELCTELAEALGKDGLIVSKEDVYRKHIRIAGKCDFVACVERAVESLQDAWSKKGIGWFADLVDDCKIPGCVKVCLYYGSSSYTTAEMSRLLDSVIQDCEDCGICTMTPEELSKLKAEWK